MESYSIDQQSQKYVNIIDFKLTLVSDENLEYVPLIQPAEDPTRIQRAEDPTKLIL
jgi:hypothetical protein